jgi:catechol 2,3-dioxygenase-like lactoylglutathione lyase family enzyme
VIIRASNLAAAKRFYHDVMGFPIATERPELLGFDTGSFTLYVERGTGDATPVFDVEHDGKEENKARLITAGCKIVEDNPAIPGATCAIPSG